MSLAACLWRFPGYVIGRCLFALSNCIDWRHFLLLNLMATVWERMRRCGLRLMGAQIGCGSFVRHGAVITEPANLQMGENSKIGIRCELNLFAPLSIGDNTEIGSELLVHTSEHVFSDPEQPLTKQGSEARPVRIGNDVYIGSRVVILHGCVIGDRVIIAAGAVVTSNLAGGHLYAGVPAKPIKTLPVATGA